MGSARQHIASIERYERFLTFLRNDGSYPDWAVVAVFYIAVHYSRALLSHENILVTSHPSAQAAFYQAFGDRACYKHLEILKKEAEKARYDNIRFSWPEVDRLVNRRLAPFKTCAQLLAAARGLSLPT